MQQYLHDQQVRTDRMVCAGDVTVADVVVIAAHVESDDRIVVLFLGNYLDNHYSDTVLRIVGCVEDVDDDSDDGHGYDEDDVACVAHYYDYNVADVDRHTLPEDSIAAASAVAQQRQAVTAVADRQDCGYYNCYCSFVAGRYYHSRRRNSGYYHQHAHNMDAPVGRNKLPVGSAVVVQQEKSSVPEPREGLVAEYEAAERSEVDNHTADHIAGIDQERCSAHHPHTVAGMVVDFDADGNSAEFVVEEEHDADYYYWQQKGRRASPADSVFAAESLSLLARVGEYLHTEAVVAVGVAAGTAGVDAGSAWMEVAKCVGSGCE